MKSEITLMEVEFIPQTLEPAILYVSDRFKVAGHLCPCGCGSKIITPIGPMEWSFFKRKGKPTLDPSIGNWQIPCRSHYWIRRGKIEWSYDWTDEKIEEGRKKEQTKLESYYSKQDSYQAKSIFGKIKSWLASI